MTGDGPLLIVRGPKDAPFVALTFDDGPHPDVTPMLLDVLARHEARATFFLIGERALRWPELAVQIAEAGHTIGSHGFRHRRDWWRSTGMLGDELDRTEAVIGPFLREPRLFRPPFGMLSPAWLIAARRRGYTCVLWNVASHDWKTRDTDRIVRRVGRRVGPGALVLSHECRARTGEGYRHTVAATDRVLGIVEERGMRAVSVSEYVARTRQ